MKHRHILSTLAILLVGILPGLSQVPQLVNFQGRVAVDGENYDGPGRIKVAIINPDRPATVWSNDGTSANASEPTNPIAVTVTNGLYSILLGDATLTNMRVLPSSVFSNENLWIRVWFDDGKNGSQLLAPDQRIAAVGYALLAEGVPAGAISSSNLANGAVTSAKIANNAITNAKLADNSVGPNELGPGAVTAADIANNAVGTNALDLTAIDSRYVVVGGDLMTNALNSPILRVENNATTGAQAKAIEATTDSSSSSLFTIHGIQSSLTGGTSSAAVRAENRSTGSGGVGIHATQDGAGWGVWGVSQGTTGSGRGVYGRSNGNSGRGVYGLGNSITGTNYGVFGDSNSPDGYGGYFTNTGTGSGVGLYASGGNNTAADIVLGGNDDGRIFSNPAFPSSDVWLHANDGIVMQLDYNNDGEDHDFEVKRGDGTDLFTVDDSGLTEWYGPTGLEFAQLQEDLVEGGGELLLRFPDGTNAVVLEAKESAGDGASLNLYNSNGSVALALDAEFNDGGPSRVTTGTVQITGGSDLSEQFEINPSESISTPEPGMIVCIDAERPGELKPSSTSHDRTVAGIISGAGGVHPGMLMGQSGTLADGEHPVALTGRVYCKMDASYGPIEPGDLITTSDTPGHGMKVTDHDQARGAIIGKAMTPLEEGTGLVLVLVSLQ